MKSFLYKMNAIPWLSHYLRVPYILEDFHKYYIVNGQLCALKYSTINTLNLFTSWVITRTNQKRFELPSQYFLSLTYQEFNKFRQENMSRMTKVPTTQTPSITKPLLGHNTKSKLDYIPHFLTYLMNLFVNLLSKTYFN